MAAIPGVITMDGPAGVGKSTLAKRLAAELGVPYLDTGAMYRTIGLRLGAGAADMTDAALRAACARCRFTLEPRDGVQGLVLCCCGDPVGAEIRTEKAGRLASLVARLPVVREELQKAQKAMGDGSSLVAEGRDMGTKVFPEARYKFFLDARPEVRARRRYLELGAKGTLGGASFEDILEGIRSRDAQDRGRAVDPLRPADDAVVVDTSDLDLDGVLRFILDAMAERQAAAVDDAPSEDGIARARAELRLGEADALPPAIRAGGWLAEARIAGAIAARHAGDVLPLAGTAAPAVELHCSLDAENGVFTAEASCPEGPLARLCVLSAVQTAASAAVEIAGVREASLDISLRD